ncbi:MAG: hypothetical protein J6V22_03345 [Clostridia bacterium]|nr:hypothetical protein [Clostridia bacterium]
MVIVFCGHSNYIQNTNDETNILHVLEVEAGNTLCEIFLGGYGRFDDFALLCAKKFKQRHPNTKLILVTPYLKNAKMDLEKATFDSIIYPNLEHVPPRYAISHRNKWMIEQADIVVCYVSHKYGGAYAMYADAKRKGKRIHNLGSLK